MEEKVYQVGEKYFSFKKLIFYSKRFIWNVEYAYITAKPLTNAQEKLIYDLRAMLRRLGLSASAEEANGGWNTPEAVKVFSIYLAGKVSGGIKLTEDEIKLVTAIYFWEANDETLEYIYSTFADIGRDGFLDMIQDQFCQLRLLRIEVDRRKKIEVNGRNIFEV